MNVQNSTLLENDDIANEIGKYLENNNELRIQINKHSSKMLTNSQKNLNQIILEKLLLYSIHLITNTGIFVNGIGGCGKSHIILTIYEYC